MGLFTWKKETAGFNDNNNFQAQIDVLNTNIDAHHGRLNAQRIDLQTLKENTDFQLGNIKSVIDKQTSRIEELEKGMDKFKGLLRAAFNTITDLDNKVKALENQIMPQQSIQDVKPKHKRILNSYADSKFNKAFEIASGYYASGLNQTEIAYKLNQLKYRSARGQSFDSKAVSKLLTNRAQKQRFMQPKVRNGKQP